MAAIPGGRDEGFTCAVARLEALGRASQLSEQLLCDAVRVVKQMYRGERSGRLLLRSVRLARRAHRPLELPLALRAAARWRRAVASERESQAAHLPLRLLGLVIRVRPSGVLMGAEEELERGDAQLHVRAEECGGDDVDLWWREAVLDVARACGGVVAALVVEGYVPRYVEGLGGVLWCRRLCTVFATRGGGTIMMDAT